MILLYHSSYQNSKASVMSMTDVVVMARPLCPLQDGVVAVYVVDSVSEILTWHLAFALG